MDINIFEVLNSYHKIGSRKVFTSYVPSLSAPEHLSQPALDCITRYILMMEFDDWNYFIDFCSDSMLCLLSWAFFGFLLAIWTLGWIACSCTWKVCINDAFLNLTIEDLKKKDSYSIVSKGKFHSASWDAFFLQWWISGLWLKPDFLTTWNLFHFKVWP